VRLDAWRRPFTGPALDQTLSLSASVDVKEGQKSWSAALVRTTGLFLVLTPRGAVAPGAVTGSAGGLAAGPGCATQK